MRKQLSARSKRFWRETGRPFLVLAIVMFSFRSAFADWNDVPTGSMKPTIVEGDRVVVNKLAYDLKVPFTLTRLARWNDPARGDVVVFFSPHNGTRLVKRVIGVPGDTLEMRNELLVLNGEAVMLEGATEHDVFIGTAQLGEVRHAVRLVHGGGGAITTFGPVTVPHGRYFVMGDNRDESFDSRYFGTVARKQIVGRATAVAFSLNRDEYFIPRSDRTLKHLK